MGRKSRAVAKRACMTCVRQKSSSGCNRTTRKWWSISWRSLFMNCAMLHRVNIYNRATKDNCIFRPWWEADPGSIFCAFNFASSGVQSCVSRNVTSWGKPAREIPKRQLRVGFRYHSTEHWGKSRNNDRRWFAKHQGAAENVILTSQRVTGRQPKLDNFTVTRRALPLELLEMGMFFGHLTMYNRTQKLNIFCFFSLCHSRRT